MYPWRNFINVTGWISLDIADSELSLSFMYCNYRITNACWSTSTYSMWSVRHTFGVTYPEEPHFLNSVSFSIQGWLRLQYLHLLTTSFSWRKCRSASEVSVVGDLATSERNVLVQPESVNEYLRLIRGDFILPLWTLSLFFLLFGVFGATVAAVTHQVPFTTALFYGECTAPCYFV